MNEPDDDRGTILIAKGRAAADVGLQLAAEFVIEDAICRRRKVWASNEAQQSPRSARAVGVTYCDESCLVEARGVEPLSESAESEETTCLFDSCRGC